MAKPTADIKKTCEKCEKQERALQEIERLAKLGEGYVMFHILKEAREALR